MRTLRCSLPARSGGRRSGAGLQDKHDVLKELAEEVTKIINECVEKLGKQSANARQE